MKLLINLVKTGSLIIALLFASCSDSKETPEKLPEETPPEVTPPTPSEPDGPYVYDNDLDYDTEAFLNAYKGTAYQGPHHVPGTVEAEDFDEGVNGVAYYESDSKTADGYRSGHAVDIRGDARASGGYYIGEVQPGEWICYTIEVDEAGTYSIDTYCVKGCLLYTSPSPRD